MGLTVPLCTIAHVARRAHALARATACQVPAQRHPLADLIASGKLHPPKTAGAGRDLPARYGLIIVTSDKRLRPSLSVVV